MTLTPSLFRTVARQDPLGFWASEGFDSRKVTEFLSLSKPDIAKLSGVSISSVRFDQKIPKEVTERLLEIANICSLVAEHFGGNPQKTAMWFTTPNPLLGNISPRDMIRFGRYSRLRRFVIDALQSNDSSTDSNIQRNESASAAASA